MCIFRQQEEVCAKEKSNNLSEEPMCTDVKPSSDERGQLSNQDIQANMELCCTDTKEEEMDTSDLVSSQEDLFGQPINAGKKKKIKNIG